ncbi:unnamed protein product [Parajaminaea phylloscopi]
MSTKKTQDSLLKQFRSITNAAQADAVRILKARGWKLEAAVEAFYNDPAAQRSAAAASTRSSSDAASSTSTKKLNDIFGQYKDEDEEDAINIEGTMQYCEALGVSPEDVVLLPLSYYLESPTMGRFTRQGFLSGWKTLSDNSKACDTVEGQKGVLPALLRDFQADAPVKGELAQKPPKSAGLYKKTYEYAYTFARPEGQKSLPLDTALAFWDLILPYSPTYSTNGGPFTQEQLQLWKEFLTSTTNGRAVSKDTWSLFLDFTRDVGPTTGDLTFASHDFDAAWPSLIDGFVTWARERTPAAASAPAMDES